MAKIDCSNIFNFMSEWERRRKSEENWTDIIEYARRGGFGHIETLKSSVRLLQEWSDEHPRQTRKDKFIQMCKENGFEKVIKYHSEKDVCEYPCCIFNCAECKEYWNEVAD